MLQTHAELDIPYSSIYGCYNFCTLYWIGMGGSTFLLSRAALARACGHGFAAEKHRVQLDGSTTAHDLEGLTATSFLNRTSYSSQGVPSNSLLAFTMMEL